MGSSMSRDESRRYTAACGTRCTTEISRSSSPISLPIGGPPRGGCTTGGSQTVRELGGWRVTAGRRVTFGAASTLLVYDGAGLHFPGTEVRIGPPGCISPALPGGPSSRDDG
jgi:hypothetical protein